MTKADKITMVRVVLSPVFFLAAVSVYILVPLFIVMELTDYFDGATARKLGEVSDFGKLFDPFGDVLTHLVMMLCFVVDGYMPPYLYVVVLMREYGMLFMRMLLVRQGVAMGARKGGKFKTVLYLCPVPGAGIVHKARGVGRGARTACGGMRMAVRCWGPGGGGVVCGLPGAVQEDNGAGKKGGGVKKGIDHRRDNRVYFHHTAEEGTGREGTAVFSPGG